MTSEEQIQIRERITAVEVSLDETKEVVKEIKGNHLVHIQAGIDKVDGRLWWLLGSVILGILTSIALAVIF